MAYRVHQDAVPATSLTSLLSLLPLAHGALATPAAMHSLEHGSHSPTSESLHLLWPLPGVFFPWISTWLPLSPLFNLTNFTSMRPTPALAGPDALTCSLFFIYVLSSGMLNNILRMSIVCLSYFFSLLIDVSLAPSHGTE